MTSERRIFVEYTRARLWCCLYYPAVTRARCVCVCVCFREGLEWECTCCREQIKGGVDATTNLLFKHETVAEINALNMQSTSSSVTAWIDTDADRQHCSTIKPCASYNSSKVRGTPVESYFEAMVLGTAEKVRDILPTGKARAATSWRWFLSCSQNQLVYHLSRLLRVRDASGEE
eukprot:1182716-Prorocentrum_minimum.AAC.1